MTYEERAKKFVAMGFPKPRGDLLFKCYVAWCQRVIASRKWTRDNPDKVKQIHKASWAREKSDPALRAARLEKRRREGLKRRLNPQYVLKHRAMRRRWEQKNIEKVRARKLAYYHANRERIAVWKKQWFKKNKDKAYAAAAKRRDKIRREKMIASIRERKRVTPDRPFAKDTVQTQREVTTHRVAYGD